MTQPITINQRTMANVVQLVDHVHQSQETLRTYIEAVGAALDVPPGWRFDVQSMTFMPPTNPATTVQEESAPPNGERTE